ncbi:MAG: acyloxyacyl hydrolase [Ahrensia sp.]|nr:acyloxyacyl hydrolase [Ahrensia sp.]
MVVTVVFGLSAPAHAFDGIIDEARFGGTWAQPEWLDSGHPEDNQFGLNAEILFRQFEWDMRAEPKDDFLHVLATPRFHIGGMVNFDSDGTDYVYAGLTWQYRANDILFFELGFGAGLNNGEDRARPLPNPTRAGLGSSLTFRESFAVGFNLSPQASLVFQVEHLSHAELLDDDSNRGLSNASVRLGYKF